MYDSVLKRDGALDVVTSIGSGVDMTGKTQGSEILRSGVSSTCNSLYRSRRVVHMIFRLIFKRSNRFWLTTLSLFTDSIS